MKVVVFNVCWFLVTIAILTQRTSSLTNIVYPRNGTIVKPRSTVSFRCRTNGSQDWFSCVWVNPRNKITCAIQEKEVKEVCEGDNRISFSRQGRNNYCDIALRDFSSEDIGQWTCILTDIQQVTIGQSKVTLEGGSPARLNFMGISGNTLRVTEGQTVEVSHSHKRND